MRIHQGRIGVRGSEDDVTAWCCLCLMADACMHAFIQLRLLYLFVSGVLLGVGSG
jgi:hypothetical protein